MPRRIQTTHTFKTKANAKRFVDWLAFNCTDGDLGYPRFIDLRLVGPEATCVEYVSESDLARGVAIGCDLADGVPVP